MNSKPDTAPDSTAPVPSPVRLGWEEFSRGGRGIFRLDNWPCSFLLRLAMTATIGTVIQQGERPETYMQEYGEEAYRWFVRLVSSTSIIPGGSPVC